MRADAVRNRARLIAVATEAFTEHGANASLDDIAKRAGVGPGTLYRHFPTREALQQAVYRESIEDLCAKADELVASGRQDLLGDWLRYFADYLVTKRGLGTALMSSLGKDSEVLVAAHEAIRAAGSHLLEVAKRAGTAREDVTISDIFKLVHGVGLATEPLPDRDEQADRLLAIVLDGLRPR
jgi:AcrR family transcriptional regulator